MYCLWCDRETVPQLNWKNLFMMSKPHKLCAECARQLEFLSGNRCVRCSRPCDANVCRDCKWRDSYMNGQDALICNYSVFAYNSSMQEMIAKWKYRGDYCLGECFQAYVHDAYKNSFAFLPKETLAVPIPLSKQRQEERKFNQAAMLASFLPIHTEYLLERTDGEKQSKKTRKERLQTKNPFSILKKVNKTVLLVDDIYTTGTTLRHAAEILRSSGCTDIYALTLIRG